MCHTTFHKNVLAEQQGPTQIWQGGGLLQASRMGCMKPFSEQQAGLSQTQGLEQLEIHKDNSLLVLGDNREFS